MSTIISEALAAYQSNPDKQDLEEAWSASGWAGAVDALDEAWREGRLPGVLLHGTGMKREQGIRRAGLLPTEAEFLTVRNGRRRRMGGWAVHLGTPRVAGWYAWDSFSGSEDEPIIVAVDLAEFFENGRVPDAQGEVFARYGLPDGLVLDLVSVHPDANSIDSPGVSVEALGAPDEDAVRLAWRRSDRDWQACLEVFGAVAIRCTRNIPTRYIRVMKSPEDVMTYLERAPAIHKGSGTPIARVLQEVADTVPSWSDMGGPAAPLCR
jgi:hypothetical protein